MRAITAKRRTLSRGYFSTFRAKYPERILFLAARARARRAGVPFMITAADIHIPSVCPVFGIPLVRAKDRPNAGSPSLDRIVPTRGYVPGNIQVLSSRANTLKNDATITELEMVVAYMKKCGAEWI